MVILFYARIALFSVAEGRARDLLNHDATVTQQPSNVNNRPHNGKIYRKILKIVKMAHKTYNSNIYTKKNVKNPVGDDNC